MHFLWSIKEDGPFEGGSVKVYRKSTALMTEVWKGKGNFLYKILINQVVCVYQFKLYLSKE